MMPPSLTNSRLPTRAAGCTIGATTPNWPHACRTIRPKLAAFGTRYWTFYRDLLASQRAPTVAERLRLEEAFDALVEEGTTYAATEPVIETLRLVWVQNLVTVDERFRWRTNDETPLTGRYIGSPYDVDARHATKRQTHWVGYNIHLTETYGDDQPNLITNVEPTNAVFSDDAVTETIHTALAETQLLPEKHVADTG